MYILLYSVYYSQLRFVSCTLKKHLIRFDSKEIGLME